MSSNCSFRITRATQDLANTISMLSQRLVDLEKKVSSIEHELSLNSNEFNEDDEVAVLDGVADVLNDCKELLNNDIKSLEDDSSKGTNYQDNAFAA